MTDTAVFEAVAVLNATQHRGARNWHYDGTLARVMPYQWHEREYPPSFTPFKAVTVARWLMEIGATGPAEATARLPART